jgi:hypothetical protein
VADVAVIILPLLIVYQINFLCASVIKYEGLSFFKQQKKFFLNAGEMEAKKSKKKPIFKIIIYVLYLDYLFIDKTRLVLKL